MEKNPYNIPFMIRFNRMWMRPFFRGVFYLISQVHITGKENIPKQGPYIAAINHLSLFEPPFMIAFWPKALEAVGAVEIWSKPGQGILARLYGGIQVRRGEFDRQVIERTLTALEAGKPLLIAPEGGRSHAPGLQRAKPGLAYIVSKTNVPVIPVGIVGSTDDFLEKALHAKRPRLEMRIGKPLQLPPVNSKGAEKRAMLQRNVDQIMLAIAELLPKEYRGVYSSLNINAIKPA
jgi:1-acyl-sn-glycerol-3-phosphate acyltransferase